MKEILVKVKNRAGMHARPAALFVEKATTFSSKIYIEKNNERVNGKSIMGVITLEASFGTELKIIAEGSDEEQALQVLAKLFENKFEEE